MKNAAKENPITIKVKASQLLGIHVSPDERARIEKMKKKLSSIRVQRSPLYLTSNELEEISLWRLRYLHERGRLSWDTNTDEIVRSVTQLAFSITHPDKDYKIELRLGILCSLHGVGVLVASTLLALTFPDEYAMIDARGWRQVFGKSKHTFFIRDYKLYLKAVKSLSLELGWPVLDVDLAIWEYDRITYTTY